MANPRVKLIGLRVLAKKSRAELALEIGVSEPHIYRVELGERDASYTVMKKWIQALGPGAGPDIFFIRQDAA